MPFKTLLNYVEANKKKMETRIHFDAEIHLLRQEFDVKLAAQASAHQVECYFDLFDFLLTLSQN